MDLISISELELAEIVKRHSVDKYIHPNCMPHSLLYRNRKTELQRLRLLLTLPLNENHIDKMIVNPTRTAKSVIIFMRADWYDGVSRSGLIHKPQIDSFLNLLQIQFKSVTQVPLRLNQTGKTSNFFTKFYAHLVISRHLIIGLTKCSDIFIYGVTKMWISGLFSKLLKLYKRIKRDSTIWGVITDIMQLKHQSRLANQSNFVDFFLTYSPLIALPNDLVHKSKRVLIMPATSSTPTHAENRIFDFHFSGTIKYNREVWLEIASRLLLKYNYVFSINIVAEGKNAFIKSWGSLQKELEQSKFAFVFLMRSPGENDVGIRSFWDAVLCGAIPLVQYEESAHDFLDFGAGIEPYRHFIPYKSLEELISILDLYHVDKQIFSKISSNVVKLANSVRAGNLLKDQSIPLLSH